MPLTVSNQQFMEAIQRFRAKVEKNLDQVAVVAISELCNDIIENTPVDTGALRAAWWPSLEAPSLVDGVGPPLQEVLSSFTPGQTFYFSNNKVYARRIEYGFAPGIPPYHGKDRIGRQYHQAPQHFVASAVARWDEHVMTAVARVTR